MRTRTKLGALSVLAVAQTSKGALAAAGAQVNEGRWQEPVMKGMRNMRDMRDMGDVKDMRARFGVFSAASRVLVAMAAAAGLVLGWTLAGEPLAAQSPASPQTPPSSPPTTGEAPPAPQNLERVTFNEAVQRARERNPTVQEAVAEALRAEALLEQTRAASMPQVTANAAYTRIGTAIRFGPQVFTPLGVTTANGTLAVPVLNLTKWAQWAHSIDDRKAAELSAEDVRRRVAVSAANAYLAVISRRRTLEVNLRAAETAKAHFGVSHQRQVAGAAARLEEVQAGQELSADQVLVEQARIDLRRAQEALGVLLAVDGPVDTADEPTFQEVAPAAGQASAQPSGQQTAPAPASGSASEPASGQGAGAGAAGSSSASADLAGENLAGLDERRTDLRLLSFRQTAAERVLRDSWRDYVPTLDFSLQELFTSPATPFTLSHNWQAQLVFTWPLYDGGLRRGLAHERKALVAQADANLQGARNQARSEVRVAAEAIRLADQAVIAAREAARQAHDALSISNLSYGAGASTSLDVLDSERRARDADTQVATAEDAARQARLDLLVASGRFP